MFMDFKTDAMCIYVSSNIIRTLFFVVARLSINPYQ